MAEEVTRYSLSEMVDHKDGWDWEKSHVSESYIDNTGAGKSKNINTSDIVEAGTVLICAGPADLGNYSDAAKATQIKLVPIGMVESAQISMNKQINRIFEIGSKISYLVPGRMMGGISLSRVFFDGASLLKALYRGEVQEDSATANNKTTTFISGGDKSVTDNIGSENVAMNLDSAFFDHPLGLAFIFRDQNDDNMGQIYFEGCYISTYGMGISAGMNVLTESVSIEFIKCRPIITAATGATSGFTDRNIVSDQAASI